MLRYVLKGVFIISLVLSMYTVKAQAAEMPVPEQFPDLPTGWSRDAVVNAVNSGLLNGIDGKILPKSYLTRAQLSTIINRAFGTSVLADLSLYVDVPVDSWYRDELSYSVGNRTLIGYNNRLFPNRDATREEVFVVLARIMDPEHPSDLSAIKQFSDFDLVSGWAAYDLAAMIESGYMHGAGGRLQPKTKITREEFAYVIDQFSDRFVGASALHSETPEPSVQSSEFELVPSEQTNDDSKVENESVYTDSSQNAVEDKDSMYDDQTLDNEEIFNTKTELETEHSVTGVFKLNEDVDYSFVSEALGVTTQLYTSSTSNIVDTRCC